MRKIKETEKAMIVNDETYLQYFDRLSLIATSIFEWEGLDEVGGNSRFLEQTLFKYGRACFVKDEELGFLSICANPSDKLNVYNLPTKIEAWSIGYSKQFDYDKCVYIMNNEMQMPTLPIIKSFAYRLYEIERTTDINVIAQKTPVLLEGDKGTMLTLKNAYMQFSGNMPFMFGNKNYNLNEKINCVKTEAPYIVDKLDEHKARLWAEILTFLGINNANTDKKERLITDEVNSNNQLVAFNLNNFYKTRKKACDEINKMFFGGEEKIKIKLNEKLIDLLNETNTGGVENGEIYDNYIFDDEE